MIDRRLRFAALGSWVCDQRAVGNWLDAKRLFEKTPKEEASKLRPTPVEAEGKLVQIPLKVVRLHGSLMGSEQPTLQQARDAMNAWEGHMGQIAGTGHRTGLVQIVLHGGRRVGSPAVGDDPRARCNAGEQE